MCECSSHISRLESEVRTLRAHRERDLVAHEILLNGLALGAFQLLCGVFLVVIAIMTNGVVGHAWAPAAPLIVGGAILVVCSALGVFAPAKMIN